MRMINRLIEPTKGTIRIDGQDISTLDPVELRRNTGYVIQEIGLFPHMTIEQNISLVPRLKKEDPKKYTQRADELLNLVGLDPEIYKSRVRSEEHTSELQSRFDLVCRLLLEKKKSITS